MCESDDTCCTGTCDIATLFPLPKPFGRRLFFLRNTGKSLLLPPFAVCDPPYGGSQASPLRWRFAPCSRLGALHPSLRPTPLRVVGFGAAVLLRSVLTPRCFAPFFRPTPSPSVARRLRRCAAPLVRAHGSVLSTLFSTCPPLRRVAGFAAALPRLTSESACVFRSQFSAEPFRRFSAFGV